MPAWKPAYLIHGDDHGRIAERRAALKTMAEAEAGTGGVELLEGEACTPEDVHGSLTAMTFAMGRRFVIADGVERWKESDVEVLAEALAHIGEEELTVAFFGKEEGRFKVPKALHDAVEAAGGVIASEGNVKPWELPKWCQQRAQGLGIELDGNGARALVAQVGERQQRLLRELEKLALDFGPGARIGVEEVEAAGAASAERKVWTLGDALVAGSEEDAIRVLLELRGQGERIAGLIFTVARRLREALAVAEALAAGRPTAEVKRSLRMPPKVADKFVADVARRDVEAFRRALELIADLELESRGGTETPLSEDTAAVRALIAASG